MQLLQGPKLSFCMNMEAPLSPYTQELMCSPVFCFPWPFLKKYVRDLSLIIEHELRRRFWVRRWGSMSALGAYGLAHIPPLGVRVYGYNPL